MNTFYFMINYILLRNKKNYAMKKKFWYSFLSKFWKIF